MINKTCVVELPKDTDAAPVAVIVQIASRYESTIHIIHCGRRINAKSIMGVMSMGIANGLTVEVEADGEDEEAAVDGIIKYISSLA